MRPLVASHSWSTDRGLTGALTEHRMPTGPLDVTRDLLDRLDARLREAQQIRRELTEQSLRRPVYPDRRRQVRAPDEDSNDVQ